MRPPSRDSCLFALESRSRVHIGWPSRTATHHGATVGDHSGRRGSHLLLLHRLAAFHDLIGCCDYYSWVLGKACECEIETMACDKKPSSFTRCTVLYTAANDEESDLCC